MSLDGIDALDLTHAISLDVADAGDALDIRILAGSVQMGAWTYRLTGWSEGWEDALPSIYDDDACVSAAWTFPLAEEVLRRYRRGEDVDTRPRVSA